MNAITTTAPPQLAYAEMERLAADMAASGLFGFKTKHEAMSIMMIAQAEGKHPATAARDYDVINRKLAKRAEAMMRDFMEGGGKVKWHALTDELADATFTHPQGGEVRISWDMARALQAGLSKKENWAKYPRQMLRNRTVSEGVRTVWPLATSGMYERGEVEDFTGKTIDGTAEPPDARDAINQEIPLKAAAAPMPRGATVRAPVEPATNGKRRTISDWLTAFEIAAHDAKSAEEANRVICSDEAVQMKEVVTGDAKQRYDEVIHTTLGRWFSQPPDDAETEAELPEIEGEARVGAG